MKLKSWIYYQIGSKFGSSAFLSSKSDDQYHTNHNTKDDAANESHFWNKGDGGWMRLIAM
jgi:hypothetical protein